MKANRTGPGFALAAAVLFGLSAPAAKLLVGRVDPWLLAGLLYLGSGVGLGLWRLAQVLLGSGMSEAPLTRRDGRWLAGAIVVGGVIGPVLLMYGLAAGTAAQSSLLLNLEGVFTALLAWSFFREHFGVRIAIGMTSIAVGAVVLPWKPSGALALDVSVLPVTGACLAWAIDNNLTRMVSGGGPVQIAALKGLAAGSTNVLLAVVRRASWPAPTTILGAGSVGLLGYGTSLVFFVLALRLLGAARTGAYFSTAPFIGAIVGILARYEPLTWQILLAAVLMGAGVWLHLTSGMITSTNMRRSGTRTPTSMTSTTSMPMSRELRPARHTAMLRSTCRSATATRTSRTCITSTTTDEPARRLLRTASAKRNRGGGDRGPRTPSSRLGCLQ